MTGASTHVLIVDDNPMDRQVLSAILRADGYSVTNAVDGEDALQKFYAEPPDLVLLDALMPGKDGFEVAEEIRSTSGDAFIPIIFLTSLTEAAELARCLEAGGMDFLSKPYSRVILRAKLNAFQRMRDMHQTVQTQRDEIKSHHMQMLSDQEAAKAVFDKVTHARQLESSYIRYELSPLAVFNGDIILAAKTPANHLCLMLGDFTGHGLAAAIGAMPLSDVFYGMVEKGFALSEIVTECNRKLRTVLPTGYFCCGTAMMIDFNRCTVEYWNGGLPTAYLKRAATGEIVTLASQNLPLGILDGKAFKSETQVVEGFPGDHLFLASDGVIEARNAKGEYFGIDRLEAILKEGASTAVLTNVKTEVYDFIDDRDDDLTMLEVELVDASLITAEGGSGSDDSEAGPEDWLLSYELGPSSLVGFNPLPMLQQVMMEAPYLRTRSSEIYTVMAELYSNALEHGVLGLDSALKASADGFAEYYQARAEALANVQGYVRFEIRGLLQNKQVTLNLSVQDSGHGFDYESYLAKVASEAPGEKRYHGRGVRLLRDLCQEVEFVHPGNRVNVCMTWECN